MVSWLRSDVGKQVDDDGKYNPENVNFILPSVRTLRKHGPVIDPYGSLVREKVNKVVIGLPKGKKKEKESKKIFGAGNLFFFFFFQTIGIKSGGLVFDEMEIRHGLTFVPYTNQLIGLCSGPIGVNQVDSRSWEPGQVNNELASKSFQIFFVSTDGSTCVPLGFKATDGIDGEGAFRVLKPLIEQFADHDIKIEWGSSDGIASNKKLIDLMKENGIDYLHFFDASHMIKNLRSALCLFHIVTATCPVGFSMRTLDQLRKTKTTFTALLPDTLFPTDTMDIDHYKVLVRKELLVELAKETGEAEKGLYLYLTSMRKLHLGFLDNSLEWGERKKMLSEASSYFTSLTEKIGAATKSPISQGLAEQIETSVNSLISLQARHPTILKPSVYGTLVVENFFSIMRAKCRFPSLLEYAHTYHGAFRELVKKFSEDYVFNTARKRPGKCYGNQEGIQFCLDQLGGEDEKSVTYKKLKTENAGTPDQLEKIKKLAEQFRCSRKKLLIRETTCKDGAFGQKVKIR